MLRALKHRRGILAEHPVVLVFEGSVACRGFNLKLECYTMLVWNLPDRHCEPLIDFILIELDGNVIQLSDEANYWSDGNASERSKLGPVAP